MSDVDEIEAGLIDAFDRYRARVGPRITILSAHEPTVEELTPLMDALNRTEAFPLVNGWWIWARGKQNVLSPGWLSTWAFPSWRSREELRATAEKIHQVITTREAPICYFTAVWGAEITHAVDIAEDLSIHPFAEQLAREAGEFSKDGIGSPVRFLGAYRSAITGPPRVALRIRRDRFPFLSNNAGMQSAIAQDLIDRANTACLSIAAFGTQSSLVDLSWFEYEERALDDVWYESSRFWRMPEVLPATVHSVPVNIDAFVASYRALAALPPRRQSKLLSSIKRFDLSLARRNVGDQAIDLCTAFEQLLGSGGDGAISWSNGLRCAALVGGNDANRLATRDIVQLLYRIRNNWVHGGDIGQNVKSKTMGALPVQDVIQRARFIYSDMLRALMRVGDDVNWFALETIGAPNP